MNQHLDSISDPSASSSSHDQRRQPLNLPLPHLLLGSRQDYNNICVPLYNAAISDDLNDVKEILDNHRDCVRYSITKNYETVLHIAVLGTSYSVLEYLLSFMETKDLALQNTYGQTALCLAAIKGVVKIAKLLVNSNKALLDIPTSQGKMPLYLAAFFGKHDMVKYLFSVENINGRGWTREDRRCFFLNCIEADMFGIALKMVEKHSEPDTDVNAIRVLARKPQALVTLKNSTLQDLLKFYIGPILLKLANYLKGRPQKLESQTVLRRIILTRIMELPKDDVDDIIRGRADDQQITHVLFIAAERGNTAFVADLIRQYPDIASEVNDNNQTIFHVAVLHRHVGIYVLLHEIGTLKDSIITLEDKNGNNMLHLVGMRMLEQDVTHQDEMKGMPLRMQRELLWFMEVKETLPPCFQEKKNRVGLTPSELFTKNSILILQKDEEWLKGTVEQLMVVAALTASVTFAASITFAGGYNQDTGSPMFSSSQYFSFFQLSTATSFACSCLAILIGLSILAFNINEEDFLLRIPGKLTIAIASIFLAVTTLLLAISCNFWLLYENKSKKIPSLAVLVIYLPVLWLAIDVYPILAYSAYYSLYNEISIFNRKKRILYKPNTQIWHWR